jgi:hypothetical protein
VCSSFQENNSSESTDLAKSKIIYLQFGYLLLKSDKTLDTNIFMRKIKYVRAIIIIFIVKSKNIESQLCMNNYLHMQKNS